MWKDCGLIHYFEIKKENKTVTNVVLLNIEFGIAWNPFGKKIPLLGEWVWCEPNNTVKFIKQLYDDDFLCILHAESKEVRPVIDEIQNLLHKPLLSIVGLDIENTVNFLNTHWNGLISCPVNLSKDVKYLSIPNYKHIDGLENTKIPMLTIAKNLPIVKTMIILMGQPGSGKTTYANELQRDGFVVINENESRP